MTFSVVVPTALTLDATGPAADPSLLQWLAPLAILLLVTGLAVAAVRNRGASNRG